MRTAYISHPDCLEHDTGVGHPENAARLGAIEERLKVAGLFDFLIRIEAPEVTREQVLRVHGADFLDAVERHAPSEGRVYLDPDTVMSPGSLRAARRAAGAVVEAVDLVMRGEAANAFCAVRPPGHHAEDSRAMGFCIFNNIAIGAAHALAAHGLQRVAVLDFDVHQGNGTEQIFLHDERVLFCSTFQYPFYPGTPLVEISDTMVSVPLQAGATGVDFRAAVETHWLPALRKFEPQMLFVSAGFDAHRDDDMAGLGFSDDDYRWISGQIVELAEASASGRIVSALEGGYELRSLARCAEIHIRSLMGLD